MKINHLKGVDAIAQGLGHLTAQFIPDQAMDEDSVEGGLARLVKGREDHAGHPEENDVIAGDQDVRGEEGVKIG